MRGVIQFGKCSYILPMIAALVGCSGRADSVRHDRDEDIAALREAKLVTWPGFYKNNDADGLAAFLSDGFVFVQNTGAISTKNGEVEWVRNNRWSGSENDDFISSISDIAFQSPDVAIIYGKGTSTRTTEDGEPCAHSYWSSNTLRREDGRWRPTFSHVSGVKCEVLTTAGRVQD